MAQLWYLRAEYAHNNLKGKHIKTSVSLDVSSCNWYQLGNIIGKGNTKYFLTCHQVFGFGGFKAQLGQLIVTILLMTDLPVSGRLDLLVVVVRVEVVASRLERHVVALQPLDHVLQQKHIHKF